MLIGNVVTFTTKTIALRTLLELDTNFFEHAITLRFSHIFLLLLTDEMYFCHTTY